MVERFFLDPLGVTSYFLELLGGGGVNRFFSESAGGGVKKM